MKEKEYRKIKELIEQERRNGNIEIMRQLRDFLDEQIRLYRPPVKHND